MNGLKIIAAVNSNAVEQLDLEGRESALPEEVLWAMIRGDERVYVVPTALTAEKVDEIVIVKLEAATYNNVMFVPHVISDMCTLMERFGLADIEFSYEDERFVMNIDDRNRVVLVNKH